MSSWSMDISYCILYMPIIVFCLRNFPCVCQSMMFCSADELVIATFSHVPIDMAASIHIGSCSSGADAGFKNNNLGPHTKKGWGGGGCRALGPVLKRIHCGPGGGGGPDPAPRLNSHLHLGILHGMFLLGTGLIFLKNSTSEVLTILIKGVLSLGDFRCEVYRTLL